MSVFLLYAHKDRPLGDAVINSLRHKIIHFPWIKSDIYTDKNLQLHFTANKDDTIRIFKDISRNITFFLQGNIFESATGIKKISQKEPEHTLENQLIRRYREKGIAGCRGLNGMYNLFVWSPLDHAIEIACDRLGVFQACVLLLQSGGFVVTNDIALLKIIPGYSARMDKRGLFDLLYLGAAFGTRTVLQGVTRLLSNSCYRIDEKGLRLLEHVQLPFSKSRWNTPLPEIMQELEYFYVSAIKRQLHSGQKLICMQSGGKDSRLFGYHLKEAGITPQCVTIGESHLAEVFLARQVSAVLGSPWKRIAVTPQFHDMYASFYSRISNFSVRAGIMPYQMNIFSGEPVGWDYTIASFLSDPVFGQALAVAGLEDFNDDVTAFQKFVAFWRSFCLSEQELQTLFGPEAKEFITDYHAESRRLYMALADEPFQRLLAYAFFTDDRFKVGSLVNSLNTVCPMRLPCIDNDLMEFLFSLPLPLLRARRLVDLYLIEKSRKLASIPLDQNSRKCKALVPDFGKQLRYKIWYAAQETRLHMRRCYDPARATTQAYAQSFSLHDAGFKKVRAKTYDFLPALEGIVNIPAARSILDKPIPQHFNHVDRGNSVRSLIAVAWAAQAFVRHDDA